jgi:hypothetical protein
VIAPLPEPTRAPKRIVIQHQSGLHQISELWASTEQPPAFVAPAIGGLAVDGVPVALRLAAVKPRYYLYAVVK